MFKNWRELSGKEEISEFALCLVKNGRCFYLKDISQPDCYDIYTCNEREAIKTSDKNLLCKSMSKLYNFEEIREEYKNSFLVPVIDSINYSQGLPTVNGY